MKSSSPQSLLLASGSTFKIDLMKRLGYPFIAKDVDIDERRLDGEAPDDLCQRLGKMKADAGLQALLEIEKTRELDATKGEFFTPRDRLKLFSLGADQVIAEDLGAESKVFSKPMTEERAFEQLRQLQGRCHKLLCAVTLATSGCEGQNRQYYQSLVQFDMKMRTLNDEEIKKYVSIDQPLYCAGAYKIEAAGIRLFENIEGPDYTAIIGLPLTRVESLLREAEFSPPFS